MHTHGFNIETTNNSTGAELYHELQPDIERIHNESITLIMATIDSENHPHASYTPFAYIQEEYYVFISDIAPHTQHIIDRPILDILLIDDESKTRNIYARKRLSYQVKATEISRESESFEVGIKALESRGGKTVNVLKSFSDFRMFKLTPIKGTLVTGFGKAYQLNPKDVNATVQLNGKNSKLLRA